MTKTKKWCLAVGILLIGMIVLFLAGLFPRPAEAHAEVNYFSAEQYTENDQLLQEDLQLIESSQNNSLQQYMAPDINYYLYVSSATNQAQTTTLTFAEVPSIEEDVSYGAESGSMSAMYRFTAPSSESGESDYAIILKDFGDDLLVDLYGYDGVANVRSSTNRYILSVSLKSNETI